MPDKLEWMASLSRFAIAAAIVYFGYHLAQIGQSVPQVTASVDQVSQHIEPTLDEVARVRAEISEVRQLVPQVLDEVSALREQIPTVLNEVAELRKSIPPILQKVDEINTRIDPILERVDKAVAVVDQTQQQIPQVLATTEDAIASLQKTRNQILPLVPQALEEVRLTREAINPALDRVENLVEDTYFKAQDAIRTAESAGQEASEGAVKGFFTGLIKLPFQLVGTLASPIVKNIDADVAKQITEKDIELMVKAGNRAIESGRIDSEKRWENPDSGNSGSITVNRFFEMNSLQCVEARIVISNSRRKIQDKINALCKNAQNQWTLASETDK